MEVFLKEWLDMKNKNLKENDKILIYSLQGDVEAKSGEIYYFFLNLKEKFLDHKKISSQT